MTATETTGSRRSPFFGWWVVLALFVMLAFSSGWCFYGLSVILRALVEQRGFGVSATSLGTASFFVSSGVAGILVGALIERLDPRWIVTASATLTSATFLLFGRVESIAQAYVAYVLLGVGFAGISLVPATTLVTRWFDRRRSWALAFATTGLSTGGIVLTPVSAGWIEGLGLEAASGRMALGLWLGVVPITLLLLRPWPRGPGLVAGGEPVAQGSGSSPGGAAGVPFEEAVRSRFFAVVVVAFLFGFVAQVGGLTHQFRLVADRTGPELGALAVSVLAASSIAGRLTSSWLVGRVGTRRLTVLLLYTQSLALFLLGRAQGEAQLLLASAAFGSTVGSVLLMQPLLLGEAFGVLHYGRIFSLNNLLTMAGVAAGPALVGFLYDALGGYDQALAVSALFAALGASVLLASGPAPLTSRPGGV